MAAFRPVTVTAAVNPRPCSSPVTTLRIIASHDAGLVACVNWDGASAGAAGVCTDAAVPIIVVIVDGGGGGGNDSNDPGVSPPPCHPGASTGVAADASDTATEVGVAAVVNVKTRGRWLASLELEPVSSECAKDGSGCGNDGSGATSAQLDESAGGALQAATRRSCAAWASRSPPASCPAPAHCGTPRAGGPAYGAGGRAADAACAVYVPEASRRADPAGAAAADGVSRKVSRTVPPEVAPAPPPDKSNA